MNGNRGEAALIKRLVLGFVLVVLISSLASKSVGTIVFIPLFFGYIAYLMWWDLSNSSFVCGKCKKTFRIGMWQYVTGFRLSLTKTPRGLYLQCPHCKERAWASQTRD